MAATRRTKIHPAEEAALLQEKQQKTPPAKKLSKPKNPREGHRQRLRERLQRAGP